MLDKSGAVAIVAMGLAVSHPAHAQDRLYEHVKLNAVTDLFQEVDLVRAPRLVDCTLSEGARTTCFSITVRHLPKARTVGPWCPTTINDGPEQSGAWLNDSVLVDADGEFMAALGDRYDDPHWRIVDPKTGLVNVTRTHEACKAAARPDVDARYQNHCVECAPDIMPVDATMTYVIPLSPVAASRPSRLGPLGAGLAVDGVKLDGPAPVDAILSAHTVAPFDDCGGHINPHVGYHYHAVTSCLDRIGHHRHADDSQTIGMALDGHEIRSRRASDNASSTELDRCGGHAEQGDDYHYHAGSPGSNAIIGCMVAQHGCVLDDPDAYCDATRAHGHVGGRPPIWKRLLGYAGIGRPDARSSSLGWGR